MSDNVARRRAALEELAYGASSPPAVRLRALELLTELDRFASVAASVYAEIVELPDDEFEREYADILAVDRLTSHAAPVFRLPSRDPASPQLRSMALGERDASPTESVEPGDDEPASPPARGLEPRFDLHDDEQELPELHDAEPERRPRPPARDVSRGR